VREEVVSTYHHTNKTHKKQTATSPPPKQQKKTKNKISGGIAESSQKKRIAGRRHRRKGSSELDVSLRRGCRREWRSHGKGKEAGDANRSFCCQQKGSTGIEKNKTGGGKLSVPFLL